MIIINSWVYLRVHEDLENSKRDDGISHLGQSILWTILDTSNREWLLKKIPNTEWPTLATFEELQNYMLTLKLTVIASSKPHQLPSFPSPLLASQYLSDKTPQANQLCPQLRMQPVVRLPP